jgi:hypothetical protein
MVFLGVEIYGDKKIFLKKVCLNFFFREKDVPLQRIFYYSFYTRILFFKT